MTFRFKKGVAAAMALLPCVLLFTSSSDASAKAADHSDAALLHPPAVPSSSTTGAPLPSHLTLAEAEAYALQHQPAIAASQYRAEAETQRVYEARSQFFPQIEGDAVAVKAFNDDSRLAANTGITNPTILTRQSDGGSLSQLITDFGRTAFLTSSARANALSAAERTEYEREQLLLRVDQAYFAVQGAQALVKVANQTVSTNNVLLERVKAMAGADLKSSLDVNFQQVNASQARLLQLRAQARLQEGYAELSAALGLGGKIDFTLAAVTETPAPPSDAGPLIAAAWVHRPDLLSMRAARDSALRFAKAETAARLPLVTAQGGIGVNPGTVKGDLPSNYGALGLNVSVPIFTGGLLSARAREAALRAQAAQKDLAALETDTARDVYNAWVEARTAYDAISVSEELQQSAQQAFELAQSRYRVGASSIAELSQADLQEIQAEITATTARFDYEISYRALQFQQGLLH